MKRIAASLLLMTFGVSAHASIDGADGLYLVLSMGRAGFENTNIQIQENTSIRNLTAPPPASLYTSSKTSALQSAISTSNAGFKLQLGYEFTPNFSVEGGYMNLGRVKYDATYITTPYGNILGIPVPGTGTRRNVTREIKYGGWNVAGVATYPVPGRLFNNSLSVFGKLGLIDAKVEHDASDIGSSTDTKWKYGFGLGAVYRPPKMSNLGVRVEYEKYFRLGESQTSGNSDVSLMSVGFTSKF